MRVTWDGNEAAAWVAYRCAEVVAIYPITPASPMGEHADAWSSRGVENAWGQVPQVIEMQSEGGAAGTVHGALQAGALATTFTASQGLLLMIPNLYKIAGELTPCVIHVAARSIATHALSIFGDHSDVYAARQTGAAMLCSGSVQEAHDFALVAHAATLDTRLPFLHFFDGFRTSHEVATLERLDEDDVRAVIDPAALAAHRDRALTPDHPVLRGTAQNPDVFFQAREAANPWYDRAPELVQAAMDRVAARTGRPYRLFEYVGHPEAERVIVMMGSGAEAAHETVESMDERVGVVKVRLYRPFSSEHLLRALPPTTRTVIVLDRAKEPGAPGEPLYLDVLHATRDLGVKVIGGRYGLSSKELDPAMIRAAFGAERHGFTLGIVDDLTHRSLPWDRTLDIEPPDVVRAVFYGLGSDGTVGANKNTIKILGESRFAQGYFVYDSKKSGAVTVSHLRFGPRPIRSSYLIKEASFVGVHQWSFVHRLDVLALAAPGATVLLNAPHPPDEVWDRLPRELQETVIERGLKLWAVDAYRIAREAGMPGRVNTVMQTCFFAISGVLPRDEAIARVKAAAEKSYRRKGDDVVARNFAVIDAALDGLHEVGPGALGDVHRRPVVPDAAPDFVQRVTARILDGHGDLLPVSAFPVDGTWPVGTSRWEKRAIALEIPRWDAEACIQCNKCVLVCPHAAIRAKVFEPVDGLDQAPFRNRDLPGLSYAIAVSPEDCTGCTLCAVVCPAKGGALEMVSAEGADHTAFERLEALPEVDRTRLQGKDAWLLPPLFEFSGACAGCGETPYVKLLTQLFGDRMLIANATGCSSIYGGNLPTTPYTCDAHGRGPAWANSLFEDNAEFGLGFRLAVDQVTARARALLRRVAPDLAGLCDAPQHTEAEIAAQRDAVDALKARLRRDPHPDAAALLAIADYLVRKSVWIVGGDGWAYDIGYGGLDHALASGRDVNILVMDTEVYSNTGGQASKATPLGAVAKFAADGKAAPKKDLGLLAMAYGTVYVAQVAFGAKDLQTQKALQEAESYPGPSLVIAYSHCIAHGYPMADALDHQKKAVASGYWPLYRFDPRRQPALQLDSGPPRIPLSDFAWGETRFKTLLDADPARAEELMRRAEDDVRRRWSRYQALAATEEAK